jgi:hypothetical protein
MIIYRNKGEELDKKKLVVVQCLKNNQHCEDGIREYVDMEI